MEVLSSAGGLQVLPGDWWSTWDVIISLHETSPGSFSTPFLSFLPRSQHLSLSFCLSYLLSWFSKLSSSSHSISPSCPLQPTPSCFFFASSHFAATVPHFLTSQFFNLLLSFMLSIIVWVCCHHLVLIPFCLHQVYFLCSLQLEPETDVKPLSKCCSVLMNEAVFYCIQVFWVLIHIFIDTFSYFIHQVTTEEYNFLIIAVKNTIRCRDSGRIVHFICSFIQLCFRYNVVQRWVM